MLARIRKSFSLQPAKLASLVVAAMSFASCATKPEPQLVADPSSASRESTLPWNEQQKWEQGGNVGPIAERMNEGAGGR
jgi:hypothetical protein